MMTTTAPFEQLDRDDNSKGHYYIKSLSVPEDVFCEDMYYMDGGFRDNKYLIPHSREFFYDQRKEFTHLRNYLKPIIDATIKPIFAGTIVRKTEGTPVSEVLWEAFEQDALGNGTSLTDAMKHFSTIAQVSGACVVCMDNDPAAGEMTLSEAMDQRKFPYLNSYRPRDIHSYLQDVFGVLTQITLRIKYEKIGNKDRLILREYTQETVTDYYQDDNKKRVELTTAEHKLGMLPVAILTIGEKKGLRDVIAPPPFYPVARVNFSLYNLVSQNEDIARSSRFPTLYAQGVEADSIVVGTKSFIGLPDGISIAPGYVSPDVQIMTDGRAEVKELVQTLYQLAEQSGVTGVVDQQSGIAKEWDFRAHEATLSVVSAKLSDFEGVLSAIFAAYIQQDLEVVSIYPTKFSPSNVMDQLDAIEKILMLQLPPLAASQLKKKAFDLIFGLDDSIEVEGARMQFDSFADDEAQSVNATEENQD